MPIDQAIVRKVAHLARLDLDEAALARMARQLDSILGYIDQLAEVDVSGVEPLVHAGDFSNILRDDVPREGLATDEALRNAPERTGPFFVVPKVVDGS